MNNINDQLGRMKAMMNYGLKTEDKAKTYSSVEFQREAADGKMYGIVREGAKFYIKATAKKSNVLKEDFDYIGGFRNRKDNEYSSYANALKNFELKMMMLKEAYNSKDVLTESWDLDKKEGLVIESTDKMRQEIKRQRQIMGNATLISEQKPYKPTLMEEKPKGAKTDAKNDPFQEKSGNKEAEGTQKGNVSKTVKSEAPKGKKGDEGYTAAKVEGSVACQSPKGGKVVKESEVLGWNDSEDYLDKQKGTEIGDSAPFNEKENSEAEADNGTVVETAMHQEGENQNSPKPGVGEIGDDAPFDKKVCEEKEDDCEDEDCEKEETLEESIADFDTMDDGEIEGDEFGDEMGGEEMPFGDDDFSSIDGEAEMGEIGGEEDAIESRISSMEELINKIAEKLGVADVSEPSFGDEGEMGGDDLYSDEEETIEEPIEDCGFYESKKYKMAMLEDRLDDFGKHPAYQKKVMELPQANHKEKEGYYDMNDESAKQDKAFGEEIGDGAPFEVDPQEIQDAISESLKRLFKKKR